MKHYYYIVIAEFNFRRIIMNNTCYVICFILKKGGEKERGKRGEAKILLIARHPNKR